MTPNLPLVILLGIMIAAGVTLILERSLTRILIGFVLIGNGVSVLYLVVSGPAGSAPIVGLSLDVLRSLGSGIDHQIDTDSSDAGTGQGTDHSATGASA